MAASNKRTERPLAPRDAQQMLAHASDAAAFLRALANEQRLCILCNLMDGPLSVSELNGKVELSQSALSQHLAVLRESEMVSTERSGQTIYYSVPQGPALQVLRVLQNIFCRQG